ncbi:MAG: SGNH/GDSL hydrolase family protein [bacterium]|nr:SGNH/GDSL hydrolase family protein [bacterium]
MSTKFFEIYKTTAVVVLNSLLLAALCLGAMALWVPEPEQEVRIYSPDFDLDSYVRISREEAILTGREFDEMGERRSYQFYPWTVFRERPFPGKLVSVTKAGNRGTLAPSPRPDSNREFAVWTLGGSTMFGWGMPDSQTVASHLQTILQERLPERRVRVTNHGHSYYFSSIELNLLISLLRDGGQPDAVVLLDGLNDAAVLTWGMPAPFFSDFAYRAWESERQRSYNVQKELPWITLNPTFPPIRMMRGKKETGLGRGFQLTRRSRYYVANEDPVAFAQQHMHTNRRLLIAVGEALGVDVYQFLQPIKGYQTGKPYAGSQPLVAAAYDALLAEPHAGLYPIVDALAGLERSHVDPTHYSDEGCYRVARAMAEVLLANQTDQPGQKME